MSLKQTKSGVFNKRVLPVWEKEYGMFPGFFRPSAKFFAKMLGKEMVISSWSHQEQMAFAAVLLIFGQNTPQIIKRDGASLVSIGLALYHNKGLWSLVSGLAEASKKEKSRFLKKVVAGELSSEDFKISPRPGRKRGSYEELRLETKKLFNREPVDREVALWIDKRDFKISYKKGPVEILKSPEMLFLDDYSDCCQGFFGAGEDCMIDGVKNPQSGFLAFRDSKGRIFAQGWLRIVRRDILLIDSIEYKGLFRESLRSGIAKFVQAMKARGFKHICVGKSPNTPEFLTTVRRDLDVERVVMDFVDDKYIYSDAKRGLIFL